VVHHGSGDAHLPAQSELAGKDGHPFHDQWWLAGAWEALQKDAGSWGMKSRKVLGGADC